MKKTLLLSIACIIAVFFINKPVNAQTLDWETNVIEQVTDNLTKNVDFGRDYTNTTRAYFKFIADRNMYICNIDIYPLNVGNPTGTITINIKIGGTNNPDSVATAKTIEISNELWNSKVGATLHLEFNSCYSIPSSSVFWLVFSHSQTNNANYRSLDLRDSSITDNTNLWHGGESYGSWDNRAHDPAFILYGTDDIVDTLPIILNSLPATSTSIISTTPDLGIFTPLFDGLVWLIFPDFNIIKDSINYSFNQLQTKFPVSIIYSVKDTFSTTTTETTYSIEYDITSITPTTTTFGTFAPNKINLFSTTTLTTYLSPTNWALLKSLLAIFFLSITSLYLYRRTFSLFS